MRRLLAVAAVATAMVAPLIAAPAASAAPAPPFVDHVEWAKWGDLSSLRIYPTSAGRQAAGLATPALADAAWTEVLTLSPDADMPGMKAQFVCHWEFAELSRPGKVSWNLEPWRNEVSEQEMVAAGCNPGGTEEPF